MNKSGKPPPTSCQSVTSPSSLPQRSARASGFARRHFPGLWIRPKASQASNAIFVFCPGNNQREQPMSFNLTSQSFGDGDYFPEARILSKDFGFGCAGG